MASQARHDRPPPDIVDGHEEFEVEAILDTRLFRGRRQYLLKWKGYPDHDASWEPEAMVTHADALLNDFWQNREHALSVRSPAAPEEDVGGRECKEKPPPYANTLSSSTLY